MRPADLLSRLQSGPLILDGGLGSMLIAAGLAAGRPPESWNLEHSGQVEAVHRAYVEAGSEVIHANTFGANPPRLSAAGLSGMCREINAAGISIARRASRGDSLVAGDVGPTGLLLPPLGKATIEELRASFDEQVSALVEAGADLISIETMSDLREALAAVEAARATGLAVLASMTFEARKRGFFTIMGDPLVSALRRLSEAGATAVGCNCSVTSSQMLAMAKEAAPLLDAPLAVQPNAGKPRLTLEGVVYDQDPSVFASDLAAMVASGARLAGGCCGTTPEFISLAKAAINQAVSP